MVNLPLISANRSVHGFVKCYSKFRTSRFHPGIAFTITMVYHKSVPFTEKRPRKPKTGIKRGFWRNGTRFQFRLEHFVWKNRTSFSEVPLPRKFSMKRFKKSCSIYFPTGFPGTFLWIIVNKPCPWSRSGHWHGEEKNDGEYNARGLLDISLGGEVRLGLSYPDPVWFSYPV